MSGEKTGVMDVFRTAEPRRQTFEWNGQVEDRGKAKEVFENKLATGRYFASIVEEPGKARQVSSWSEVEEAEREQGAVAVMLTPAISGG